MEEAHGQGAAGGAGSGAGGGGCGTQGAYTQWQGIICILPPIRGSLPEVIRSWCAHHHHHHTRSSPAV